MFKKITIISLVVLTIFSCDNKQNSKPAAQPAPQVKQVVIPQFNADSAYNYVAKQLEFGPRVPGSEAHKQCAEWFIDFFNDKADTVYVQDFRTRLYNGNGIDGKNIIAAFNPEAKKRILLAAHWDSRPFADHDPDEKNWNTPIDGANDGASGVGVLMEIARLMKETPTNVGVDIILFDLEDYGAPYYLNLMTNDDWALGSQYWAKNPHIYNYRAYFGILLDMVGAPNAKFPKEYYSQQFAPALSNDVWRIAREIGYSDYFTNELGHPINDDHIYVNVHARIPMIDIIHLENNSESSFYPYWHTVKDNIEQIDPKTLGMVGDVVVNVIYR
ncbi:MAG: M28 family peptidase [Bacteroidales bacterium]|nr:M28 family peptidase [Bacteroidales bacterium]